MSGAVMHISPDSRPPVRPPCPLFPLFHPLRALVHSHSHMHCPGMNRSNMVLQLILCTVAVQLNRHPGQTAFHSKQPALFVIVHNGSSGLIVYNRLSSQLCSSQCMMGEAAVFLVCQDTWTNEISLNINVRKWGHRDEFSLSSVKIFIPVCNVFTGYFN